MTLIVFDGRAPRIGRELADAVWRLGRRAGAAALRGARRHRLEVSLAGGLGATLTVAYVLLALNPPVERPADRPAPAPAWVDVAKPLPMFAFEAPEFSRAAAAFAARRHTTGGGREDVLTRGEFSGEGPYLRLVVHQVGQEGAPQQTMFVEIARRAAEIGLALDSLAGAATLPTRFGPAEWASARFAAPGGTTGREGCAAFRISSLKPELRIAGFACGPNGAAFSRRDLSCLIGRLDLAAANEDGDLQRYFAQSELARDAACPVAAAKPAPTAAPARTKPAARASAQR